MPCISNAFMRVFYVLFFEAGSMHSRRTVKFAITVMAGSLLLPGGVVADHASASFETGAAGAVMTTPGATLSKGDLVFGFSAQFIKLDDISDTRLEALGAADEHVHSVDSLLQLNGNIAWGITDDLTVGVTFPYVERHDIRESHHDMGVGEAEFAGDAKGFGDISLFGQYRFYSTANRDIALLAGVKIPSGNNGEREVEGGLFGIEQQPGSGSWDPFAGLAFNQSWGRAGVSANILYTFTSEGDRQTELGNVFNYNLAMTYRAYSPEGGHNHHHHQHSLSIVDYVDVALELNGDVRDRVEISDVEEEHSGGHTLYVSPGIRIGLAHRISLFSSFGIPVVNDYNGVQSEPDYRVIGGFSIIF